MIITGKKTASNEGCSIFSCVIFIVYNSMSQKSQFQSVKLKLYCDLKKKKNSTIGNLKLA